MKKLVPRKMRSIKHEYEIGKEPGKDGCKIIEIKTLPPMIVELPNSSRPKPPEGYLLEIPRFISLFLP